VRSPHPVPHPVPAGAPADSPATAHGALAALCLIARLHQVAADPAGLAHQLALPPGEPASPDTLLLAARHLGLRARRVRTRTERLVHTPLPALAFVQDPPRVVVLAQCDGRRVLLQDVAAGHPQAAAIEPLERFATRWTGELILVTRGAGQAGLPGRFDYSWFLPSLVRFRGLFGEVLLVSLVLQLLALLGPLFFQVVMDKVLVHRGLSTLDVLVTGLVLVVLFEALLSGLRAQVLGHTTSRIDVELGARLYRHLVRLPLAYFQARRVGDSVARVRELEAIRQFLTGQTLTAVLDLLFAVVFVAVMLLYSVPLTLVVLASVPLYAALCLGVGPALRRRLDERFARGAENQALLVESIGNIQTLKAGALEPLFCRRWDQQLAAYVRASFRTQTLAAWAQEGMQLIGKLSHAATLWWGAHLVMDQQLTLGQFVAFHLFAQRIAQPVLRMTQLWTDFQQTGLSVARLGDVLNTPPEAAPAGAARLATVQGRITLDQVLFRYRPEGRPAIDRLSLDIRAGQVVGIVGRSGSGKSTVARLLQRLHAPEQGRVLIDGIDTAVVDVAALRRQIGVVLQDNQLFHRTVRENIAITDPAAPLDAVIRVARLAGAHGFISELPEGYETLVGEQGCTLSGGQRQRIAIARALFSDPRILLLDEATSALDYESEALLQQNMATICRGRTVIIIAHRLSAVRHAGLIVVMDRGRIVESGTHDALLGQPGGHYARLWQLQAGLQPMEREPA
jgi:subfamily B ATP-binding cassette protein HlyB/CyaB